MGAMGPGPSFVNKKIVRPPHLLTQHRGMAKGGKKNKGGGKGKGGKAAASKDDDDDENDAGGDGGDDADAGAAGSKEGADAGAGAAGVEFDPEAIDELMVAAVEALERDLGKLRTGRASPGMLENLVVEAYGDHTPLQHLGSVTARNAQTLAVMLYDVSLKGAVSKAIQDSPLGFNPRDENDVLVVPVPEMTTETKKEVAKMAARAGETAKISVRNARKKAMDMIKKAKLPEDETKRAEKVSGASMCHPLIRSRLEERRCSTVVHTCSIHGQTLVSERLVTVEDESKGGG